MFEIFEELESLPLLEDFTSTFGDLFYRKPPVQRQLIVDKSSWFVDQEIYGMVPFQAGQVMQWEVTD
jgi:dihydroorotase